MQISYGPQAKENTSVLAFLTRDIISEDLFVTSTPYLYPQISMGQNQDKLEGEEQALDEGLEETRLYTDLGGAGSLAGDVIEGGSSCEVAAGNTRESSGEPDTQDLDGSPCQEATTPSNVKHINLLVSSFVAREVRQGGAAGKEGGEGGRTAPVVPQETDTNRKSSARSQERTRAYKLINQIKREEKLAEEALQTPSKIKMEYQDEEIVPHEQTKEGISHEKHDTDASVDVISLDKNEEGSVMMRTIKCGAHQGGRELFQNNTVMAQGENENIKSATGKVGSLGERKEPPPAQHQYPLKNIVQKESLLDMSDAIHYHAQKERTENDTKQETCGLRLVLNEYSLAKAKVTDTDIQRESVRPYLQTDRAEATTHQEIDSDSASNPALSIEPSSILEKLLKRNRKEANPDISKIKEVNIKENTDVPMELNANSIRAATELSSDGLDRSECDTPSFANPKTNLATKDHHIKGMQMKQTDVTSDGLCFQPGNHICENTVTNPHYSKTDCQSSEMNINTVASVKNKIEVKPDMCPSQILSSDTSQSAVSAERASCEVSGVITEESAPSSVSDAKTPPTNRDGEIADLSQRVTAEETDIGTARSSPPIKSDGDSRIDPELSGSERAESHSVRREKVEDVTEDTANVDGGSVLVAGGTVIPEDSCQVTTCVKQDPQVTLNTEHPIPDQCDDKPGKEKDENVSRRDKSQNAPKSRPVSDLIKETIKLHEMLQHQERPKPAEVKIEEQGQSVKVAQMKAAFDSPQKSPDKAIERKPSVRKGKGIKMCLYCTIK